MESLPLPIRPRKPVSPGIVSTDRNLKASRQPHTRPGRRRGLNPPGDFGGVSTTTAPAGTRLPYIPTPTGTRTSPCLSNATRTTSNSRPEFLFWTS